MTDYSQVTYLVQQWQKEARQVIKQYESNRVAQDTTTLPGARLATLTECTNELSAAKDLQSMRDVLSKWEQRVLDIVDKHRDFTDSPHMVWGNKLERLNQCIHDLRNALNNIDVEEAKISNKASSTKK